MIQPRTLEANGSTLEYFEAGSGPPVVLLHCTGGSARQWTALTQLLSPAHRVVAPHLYGYGGSSTWDGRAAFRLRHEASLLEALLRHLEEPAHLVGHSYGGAVSLCVARAVPHRVRSLCVFEPAAFHLLREGDARNLEALAEIARVANGVWSALISGEYVTGLQAFVDYWSGCGTWVGLGASRREGLLERLPKIGLDFQATLHEPAGIDAFRQLAMPRMVLSGEQSTLAAERICRTLAALWPDAERIVVPGAGHMGPVTHSGEVNRIIHAFLQRLHEPARSCAGAATSPEGLHRRA